MSVRTRRTSMVQSRELRLPYQYLIITVVQAITKTSYKYGKFLVNRNVIVIIFNEDSNIIKLKLQLLFHFTNPTFYLT